MAQTIEVTLDKLVSAVANINSKLDQMATKAELNKKFDQVMTVLDAVHRDLSDIKQEHIALHQRVYNNHEPRITHLEASAI